MPLFDYEGRNRAGEAVSGQLEGLDRGQIASYLINDGITPVRIMAAKTAARADDKKKGSREVNLSFREKVTLDELIIFSRQMHSLSRAGVPLTRAMRGLASSVRNPLLERTVSALADELDKGRALSSAMARHPKIFSDLYISIIHVGENTGRLDDAFKQMGVYLELERNTIKNVKQATRYPIFVLVAISAAIAIINIFVIPAFKSVFDSFGGQVPWQTQALIAVSDFTVAWWHTLLAGLIAAIFVFNRWRKTENGERGWDRFKLRFPVVGSIFYRATLARFARTFSIVLAAGMPIEQGLMVVSRAVGNRYIGEKVAEMRKSIERGESFSQSATRTGMFSALVMQMLAVGEETGRVDEMLAEVASFYEEEVEYDLKNLTSAIEPILITAIGGLVLILALGVFLPLWELSTTING